MQSRMGRSSYSKQQYYSSTTCLDRYKLFNQLAYLIPSTYPHVFYYYTFWMFLLVQVPSGCNHSCPSHSHFSKSLLAGAYQFFLLLPVRKWQESEKSERIKDSTLCAGLIMRNEGEMHFFRLCEYLVELILLLEEKMY